MYINRGLTAFAPHSWNLGSPLTPSFRAVYTDSGDDVAGVYTFNDCDLGIPDNSRMNVICVGYTRNVGSLGTVTVDGQTTTLVGTEKSGGPGHRSSLHRVATPSANPTGTITVAIDAINCSIGVLTLYPVSQTPVDFLETEGNASSFTLTDLAKTAGGFTVLLGGNRNSSLTAVFSQTGAEAITEHYDNLLETRSFVIGSHDNTATTTTDDYTITYSGSGESVFHAASWF